RRRPGPNAISFTNLGDLLLRKTRSRAARSRASLQWIYPIPDSARSRRRDAPAVHPPRRLAPFAPLSVPVGRPRRQPELQHLLRLGTESHEQRALRGLRLQLDKRRHDPDVARMTHVSDVGRHALVVRYPACEADYDTVLRLLVIESLALRERDLEARHE